MEGRKRRRGCLDLIIDFIIVYVAVGFIIAAIAIGFFLFAVATD